jgi:hypothetical protein
VGAGAAAGGASPGAAAAGAACPAGAGSAAGACFLRAARGAAATLVAATRTRINAPRIGEDLTNRATARKLVVQRRAPPGDSRRG